MKKIKFALIGCGRIAPKHADILSSKLEEAQLVAVCDIVAEKARAYGEKYHVPYYLDFLEMLSKVEIDVVCILVESGKHAEIAIATAKHKKHVVVEKPMALTLTDADEMIRVCDENGVKLFVVKQNRYNLPIIKVREALKEGRFGK